MPPLLHKFSFLSKEKYGEILDFTDTYDKTDWYFLGDIHGDPRCITWTIDFLRQQNDFRFCFLGDLFDRGPDESKCLGTLLEFAENHSGKILWLAGNHDIPKPPYNKGCDKGISNSSMRGYENSLRNLPVVSWFPNGIVATHGGWRAAEFPFPPIPGNHLNEKQKRHLQTSRFNQILLSDEEAIDELPSFRALDLVNPAMQHPQIKLLIRGHDHPSEGYHFYHEAGYPSVLTLLGSTQLGVQFMPHLHRSWTTLARVRNWNEISVLQIGSHGQLKTIRKILRLVES